MAGIPAIAAIVETVTSVAATAATVGEVAGAVLLADTVTGGHLQDALGLTPEPPDLGYDINPDNDPYVKRQEAKTQAEGFTNYMHNLESIAPGYVNRHRPKLTKNYKAAIMKRQEKVDQAKEDLS